MSTSWKKFITLILVTTVMSFSITAQAGSLTQVSDTMSSHNAAKESVTHTIKFLPASNIAGPGDLRITFASGYDLTNVIASSYVSVTGGGITWDAVQNSDLVGNVLTLGWTSGTLTAGNQVQVVISFTKNPSSTGNYNITLEVGGDEFLTATDSRVIATVITGGDVAVTATVPAAPASPTVTNIVPEETIIIDIGVPQVISFTLTDANNDDIEYVILPSSTANVSVSSPASPVSGTISGKVITFTYFDNGAIDAQTIQVRASDDGFVTTTIYNIQIFII
ncbi:MAG: hypothetical protein Q8L21_01545 [Candidatus Komeilibacteria bacterium]|nr:hypothetical protein [Candidatus Komeilibacteria bacterium]